MNFLKKLFGDYSKKEIKRINPLKEKVLSYEAEYSKLSNADLKAKTPEFKERLSKGETLDDILPEAFAACREAAWRVLGLKPYPTQILGGIILHQGRIGELKTGEGKTLVAALPAYLNALTGDGVHIVTVNDYLAKRDSELMGKVYRFMGLTVGLIVHELTPIERQKAYAADITYGTNNEMGFDYLRDNMVTNIEYKVQRGHNFAIVDEVDSILIDEARTPLIISGEGDIPADTYIKANEFVLTLSKSVVKELDTKVFLAEEIVDGDYLVDEKARTATLNASGVKKAEEFFKIDNLMDADNILLQHHINQALKAVGVMRNNKDYIVKDGKVFIVDEFTGRIMEGRRYNDGLHQAIEAKEGVEIAKENQTKASITFQNYFRLYKKLSGMTGTGITENEEFNEIYALDVVAVPTYRPVIRIDHEDIIYSTEKDKFNAIVEKIIECHAKGQPVLVGTASVEKSEEFSKILKKHGLKHNVLNAKNHEKEAYIVAQAGTKGAVTIATNMAGRGTDIMLGGNAEYLAITEMKRLGYSDEIISEATGYSDTDDSDILSAREKFIELKNLFKEKTDVEAEAVKSVGGLYIIGTERHDSRRIDNQLIGRAGRQGDPGESCFYLSLDDDLLRLFGGRKLEAFMGPDDGTPIISPIVSKAILNAQTNKGSQYYAIRKNVFEYDNVLNKQREIVYEQRDRVLNGEELKPIIIDMLQESIDNNVDKYCPKGSSKDEWNLKGLYYKYKNWLLIDKSQEELLEFNDTDEIKDYLFQIGSAEYDRREELLGNDDMRKLERLLLFRNVDFYWINHLEAMETLKSGIGLRAYGQQDPVLSYKLEGFALFDEMIEAIREDTSKHILTVIIKKESKPSIVVGSSEHTKKMGVKII